MLHAGKKAKKLWKMRTRARVISTQISSTNQRTFVSTQVPIGTRRLPIPLHNIFLDWYMEVEGSIRFWVKKKISKSETFQDWMYLTINKPCWSCQIPRHFILSCHSDCVTLHFLSCIPEEMLKCITPSMKPTQKRVEVFRYHTVTLKRSQFVIPTDAARDVAPAAMKKSTFY